MGAAAILHEVRWITLALALYGAALSSWLAYLAWRKDRHSIRFFWHQSRRGDWYGLHISVVNVGFRPVILESVMFEQPEGAGYFHPPEEEIQLPLRLDEGEQVVFSFHAEDIEPDTTAFLVRDTHRRTHRMEFAETLEALGTLKEIVEETHPDLAAKGQERVAAEMRRFNAIAEDRPPSLRKPLE